MIKPNIGGISRCWLSGPTRGGLQPEGAQATGGGSRLGAAVLSMNDTQIAAAEIRLNDAPPKPPKIQLLVRTHWHRQSCIGGEIP
jgi:hypothetical protein